MDGKTERAVIQEVLEGNTNAFARIVDQHKHAVGRIVSRHVPADRVEEVAQDAFVRAFTSLASYRAEKPLGHWLAAITVRTCHDFWRAHYRNRETPLSTLAPDGMDWLDTVTAQDALSAFEGEAARREARELLDWALEQLSPVERTVLVLTHLEGHDTAEAAELMGISRANVKVRAFRARGKLRRILSGVIDQMEGKP